MSQAGVINIAGGGGGGSPILTITGNDGTAVMPIGNNVNLVGGFITTDHVNGIWTTGNNGTATETVNLTNRANVTSTTVNLVSNTVVLFTPVNDTAISFRCLVVGYDSVNKVAIGGEQLGLVRKTGGVVTVVGTNDTFDESDAALNTADWTVVSASPDLSITFTGVAAHTIDWRALFEYTQVS